MKVEFPIKFKSKYGDRKATLFYDGTNFSVTDSKGLEVFIAKDDVRKKINNVTEYKHVEINAYPDDLLKILWKDNQEAHEKLALVRGEFKSLLSELSGTTSNPVVTNVVAHSGLIDRKEAIEKATSSIILDENAIKKVSGQIVEQIVSISKGNTEVTSQLVPAVSNALTGVVSAMNQISIKRVTENLTDNN